jgi:hypothetical protein
VSFLIHYLVRTAVTPLHFDIVSSSPVSTRSLDSLRVALASDASQKSGRQVFPDDIIIANIIPLPDGEPKQIGGA